MNILNLFQNRIAVTYVVALILSLLAGLHVALPASVTAETAVAAIMLAAAAVTAVLRFGHEGAPSVDVKA